MATTINADTSDGLKLTADASGEIKLQSAGTDIVSVTANGMDVTGDFTVDTTTLYVDATNNRVGIGTSSPSSLLDLYNSATSGAMSPFTFSANNSTPEKVNYVQIVPTIEFNSPTSEAGGYTLKILQQGAYKNSIVAAGITNNASNYLAFSTTNEAMRIDSSGNVLVGTTTRSNNEKVTINQSSNAVGISVRSNGGPSTGNYESSDITHATYWTFGRDNQLSGNYVFAYNGTLRGSINISTGTYSAISDSRLKKNITNITYGLNEVMAFRPVTYLMNEEDDTAKKHLGFIAQEVKTLVDEAVDDLIDPDTQFYMLDKSELVPILVKAIQEQQTIIETLTTRIDALENA